jgi:isopenicillin-N N-acyltransferase-like protein
VLRARRKSKPSFVCLTQAGIPGGMTGLNETGVGVCVNGLTTPEDGRDLDGLPHHLRVRAILSSRTFTEALKPVMGTRHVGSTHFLIGHAGGEALGLEASPTRINTLNPEDGLYTHSNHFVGPTTGPGFERKHPSTLFRAKRLERKIRQGNKPLDLALARDLLSDHFSHPNAICAHPDPDAQEIERVTTVASVVLALDRRTMYASDGPPCESPYEAYPLAA